MMKDYVLAKKMDSEGYLFSILGKGIVVLARSIFAISLVSAPFIILALYFQSPGSMSGVAIVLVVFVCVGIEFIGSIAFYFGKLVKLKAP